MVEYQERFGMIYGVFSLFLTIGMPVIINRLLRIRYPTAFLSLLFGCIIFISLDKLIHSLLFDIPVEVHPLNNLFAVVVPVVIYLISLVIDVSAMSWQRIKEQKVVKP